MYQNIRLLKDIVDNTPLPIAVYIGEELTVELANPAMIETWGKGDEVIGKKYLEILPEIEKQQIFDQAYNVLKTGIPFHAKDKKVDLVIKGTMISHYFNYSFIPLYNEEGKIYGIMNTGTDVTDLHEAKQQVQKSNERLKIAIDASGMGTYEIDLATKKIKTSGNFNALWSIDREIEIEDLIEKFHPDDLIVREEAFKAAQLTGKIAYEARILNDDNSIVWAKINGKIINDKNGNPTTIIGIIQDITEQRQFEEELKNQVTENIEELKRSNIDLLHFAHVVSHDLKEPVRKIKIFNGLLKNETQVNFNENSRNYINKVDQSAQRMQTIIDGILAYSTINKSTQPVEEIDLNEIVENIKTDLEIIIKEKGAILIKSELPNIVGAPILIHQLFYNLVNNALKFSKAGEPPRVTISSVNINKDGVEMVQITIEDNGIGLDPIYAERIFNAFERLHSKSEYEGNGLGLALCRKIAKRHNGIISATGEIENGAKFIVTLPFKQSEEII